MNSLEQRCNGGPEYKVKGQPGDRASETIVPDLRVQRHGLKDVSKGINKGKASRTRHSRWRRYSIVVAGRKETKS